MTLVTIMIPTYNQANWIQRAVDSALAQDYPHIQIIVGNDNSMDNTIEVLEKYQNEKKVKIVSNPKNLGRVGNYKHILESHATGEWVVNLDGDDYFTDNSFISKAIRLISAEDNIVFVQAGHTVKTQDGKVLNVSLPNIENSYEIITGTNYFLSFNHFSHLASVFNREKAIALDFYRYNILSSDIESFLRLALHGNVILIHDSVGVWVHHGQNESKKLSIEAVKENMLRFNAPFDYAKRTGKISRRELTTWRRKKSNEYLLNHLTLSITNPSRLPGYFRHILKSDVRIITTRILPVALLRATKYWLKNLSAKYNQPLL